MGRPKTTPEQRAAAKQAKRAAAEEDARAMLLAAGYLPDGPAQREQIQELLRGPPGPERMLYTVREFCEAMGISASTFYRACRQGRGPQVVRILGQRRITADAMEQWLEANAMPEEMTAPRVIEPAAKKKRRVLKVPACARDPRRRATIFDPAPGSSQKFAGGVK